MDCAKWSHWMAFLAAAGPTLGIAGAVVAWLVNKFLSWFVWAAERFLTRYELMNALLADIESNSRGEQYYYPGRSPPAQLAPRAAALIDALRGHVGPYKPLAPYIPTPSGNPVYENALTSLSLLPGWVVRPIVRYYSASVQLVNQLSDFRSATYLALSQKRQGDVIRQLWDSIGREVEVSATQAQRRLKAMRALYIVTQLAFAPPLVARLYLTLSKLSAHWMTIRSDIATAITPVVEMVQSCPMPSTSKP